jgi:hypothetical protein
MPSPPFSRRRLVRSRAAGARTTLRRSSRERLVPTHGSQALRGAERRTNRHRSGGVVVCARGRPRWGGRGHLDREVQMSKDAARGLGFLLECRHEPSPPAATGALQDVGCEHAAHQVGPAPAPAGPSGRLARRRLRVGCPSPDDVRRRHDLGSPRGHSSLGWQRGAQLVGHAVRDELARMGAAAHGDDEVLAAIQPVRHRRAGLRRG